MPAPTLRASLLVGLCAVAWPLVAQRPGESGSAARSFQEAVTLAESRGDCRGAGLIFQRLAEGRDRALAARALVYMGLCHERLGRADAAAHYRRVIESFPDQRAAAAEARRRLAALTPRATRVAPTPTLRATWPSRSPELMMGGAAAVDGRTMAGIDPAGDVTLFELHTGARLRRVARSGAGTVGLKPVPAPDGHAVAFTWTSPAGALELRIARTDQVAPRILRRGEPGDAFMIQDWPVQTRLLLRRTSAAGTVTLLVLDTRTGQALVALPVPADVGSSSLSPDGRYIALDEPEAAGGRRVRIIAARDGATATTIDGPSDDGPVAWAPAGDAVVFVSNRSGTVDLWTLLVTEGRPSGPPRLLQRDLGYLIDLVGVTRDGAFHYNRQVGTVDVFVTTIDPAGTVTGNVRPVIGTRVGGNLMPSFSSDGAAITFATQHPFSARLEVFTLSDGRTTTRQVNAGVARRPLWAPDGRMLLVRGTTSDKRYGFLAVDPATNDVKPIVTVSDSVDYTLGPGGWSHDSRSLVYVMNDGVVRRHDVATGTSETLFSLPSGSRPIALAPSPRDGRVAFVLASAGATRVSVHEDGRWLDLVSLPGPGRILSATWSGDATTVLYSATKQGNGIATLMRVPATGGVASPLGLSAEGLRDLTVSPAGGHLAWTAGWPRREPWVLEHVIPARR